MVIQHASLSGYLFRSFGDERPIGGIPSADRFSSGNPHKIDRKEFVTRYG